MIESVLSTEEVELLDAIHELQYGELYEVEIAQTELKHPRMLQGWEKRLIDIIRNGNQHIDSIKIHQGKATQISIAGERGRLRYKQKFTIG
jgi:hypothetical protein